MDTILLVDDSYLVTNFINSILKKKYNIFIANDGAKAIEFLQNPGNVVIKCCLLDLHMPNVNGYEFLEYLKSNAYFSKFPVIVISGSSVEAKISSYPVSAIVPKPFNEKDIQKIISKTIDKFY